MLGSDVPARISRGDAERYFDADLPVTPAGSNREKVGGDDRSMQSGSSDHLLLFCLPHKPDFQYGLVAYRHTYSTKSVGPCFVEDKRVLTWSCVVD